jgi:ketosteroid isomerase-like protein
MSAFGRGHVAGVAGLYTKDGQVPPPGSEPITGRPGIQAFWQGARDMGVKAAKLETVEVAHHGDAVYEVGRYALEGAGGQLLDNGKYVVIWQRHGEGWKLHRDIWNTSRPA